MPKPSAPPPTALLSLRVPIAAIQLPLQPDRFRAGDSSIDELATSIERHGLLHPILVATTDDPAIFALIAGHRRLLACSKLGHTAIDARVFQLEAASLDAVRLTENVQRQDLSPLEEGVALLRWREASNLTQEAAAELIGKGLSWLKKRESLTRLPDDLMTCLHDGLISPSVALELARIEDETARSVYLQSAVTFGATQDVAAAWVANFQKDGATPNAQSLEASTKNYASNPGGHKLNCHICDRPFPLADLHNVFLCTADLEASRSAAHQ